MDSQTSGFPCHSEPAAPSYQGSPLKSAPTRSTTQRAPFPHPTCSLPRPDVLHPPSSKLTRPPPPRPISCAPTHRLTALPPWPNAHPPPPPASSGSPTPLPPPPRLTLSASVSSFTSSMLRPTTVSTSCCTLADGSPPVAGDTAAESADAHRTAATPAAGGAPATSPARAAAAAAAGPLPGAAAAPRSAARSANMTRGAGEGGGQL